MKINKKTKNCEKKLKKLCDRVESAPVNLPSFGLLWKRKQKYECSTINRKKMVTQRSLVVEVTNYR